MRIWTAQWINWEVLRDELDSIVGTPGQAWRTKEAAMATMEKEHHDMQADEPDSLLDARLPLVWEGEDKRAGAESVSAEAFDGGLIVVFPMELVE